MPYFHLRSNSYGKPRIDRGTFERVLGEVIESAISRNYLQEATGYQCVDRNEYDSGKFGNSLSAALFRLGYLHINEPVSKNLKSLTKEELLGLVEILYDLVSEGDETTGQYHSWDNCGWHFTRFNRDAGRKWLREMIETHLRCFEEGFILDPNGRVLLDAPEHISSLLDAQLPQSSLPKRRERVEAAVRDFRSGRSTWDQRLQQVFLLTTVAENLRKEAQQYLKRDESALFMVFNEFGIRHLKDHNKTEYDQRLFLTYIFYVTLAMIHLCEQIIERDETKPST